jgi:hypothetical protein
MNTETSNVDQEFGAEYQGKYVFKEISWAKRSRIIQKYTKYNKLLGDVESSDFIAIQAETIIASIHGQPESHPVTLEKLLAEEEGIPIGLGELFSKIANRLNALDRDETSFLSAPSESKCPITPSLTSASAKNSAGPQQSSQSNQPESSTNTQSSSTS